MEGTRGAVNGASQGRQVPGLQALCGEVEQAGWKRSGRVAGTGWGQVAGGRGTVVG